MKNPIVTQVIAIHAPSPSLLFCDLQHAIYLSFSLFLLITLYYSLSHILSQISLTPVVPGQVVKELPALRPLEDAGARGVGPQLAFARDFEGRTLELGLRSVNGSGGVAPNHHEAPREQIRWNAAASAPPRPSSESTGRVASGVALAIEPTAFLKHRT